ncbi:MAG: hypothetical protein R2849_10775 [Thermomicrobiales bacterium]
MIEYDNTQNNANHIHSLARLRERLGRVISLAAHYAATHSHGDHHH